METILTRENWSLKKIEHRKYSICIENKHSCVLPYQPEDQAIVAFNRAFERGWIWVDIIHYVPSVYMSEIVIEPRKITWRSERLNNTTSLFMDKNSAHRAISEVLPKAKEKFSKCSIALSKLHEELGFHSGDSYEGDTHGTYNDHSHISFSMDGFSFSFINKLFQ